MVQGMPRLRDHGVRLGTKKAGGRPFKKGHRKLGGRKKGTPNRITREVKEFLKEFVNSSEYQANLKTRILSGKALPIEQLGIFYAAGKPKEQVQVDSPSMAKFLSLAMKESNKAS